MSAAELPCPSHPPLAVEGEPCPSCSRIVPLSGKTRARLSRERRAADAASGETDSSDNAASGEDEKQEPA